MEILQIETDKKITFVEYDYVPTTTTTTTTELPPPATTLI
jgi:hypothetical protein